MTDNNNKPKKNCHAKHRERLRHRFLVNGLDGFSEHNVLEMLLFYSIPRKDTNELAHELIDRFGSLANVFDAPYEALKRIDGVGERTATLLKFIPALCGEYRLSRNEVKAVIRTRDEAVEYLAPYFTDMQTEYAVLLSLDAGGRVMNVIKMRYGSTEETDIDITRCFSRSCRIRRRRLCLHTAIRADLPHRHRWISPQRKFSRICSRALRRSCSTTSYSRVTMYFVCR